MRAKTASGQPKLPRMQKMILYLRCSKLWKPRHNARMKIKMNQPYHIDVSQNNFSTYSDSQKCNEVVKDASTCSHASGVTQRRSKTFSHEPLNIKKSKTEQGIIAEDAV